MRRRSEEEERGVNLVLKTDPVALDRVWFDPPDGQIHAEIAELDDSLPLKKIPDEDFESSTPIITFETACSKTVVVYRHQDGKETWLPAADMWLSGGFTPPAKKMKNVKKDPFLSLSTSTTNSPF